MSPRSGAAGRQTLLVDARAPFGSGLGRYFRELVREIQRLHAFKDVVLVGDPDELAPFIRTLDVAPRVLRLRAGRYSFRVPLQWSQFQSAVGGPHVSWFPNWDGAWQAAHAVSTIHDLILLEQGVWSDEPRRLVAKQWVARIVSGSAQLLTVSEESARQIRARFPKSASKLTVVPNGVADRFHRAGASGELRRSESPYLLVVANKRPHKRIETAIRAFARLAAQDPSLRLVLVGDRTAHAAELQRLAASLGVSNRVEDLVGLDDDRLAEMYGGAECLLVPSRDEGFGLVGLEAMACGTPVIAVDRPTLREVLGEGVSRVPYDDDTAMAAAIDRLRRDEAFRAESIRTGRAHASAFTWTRAAERTAEVLLRASSR